MVFHGFQQDQSIRAFGYSCTGYSLGRLNVLSTVNTVLSNPVFETSCTGKQNSFPWYEIEWERLISVQY